MTLRMSPSQFAKLSMKGGRQIIVEKCSPAHGTFGLDRELRPIVDRVDLILPRPPSVNALTFNRADGGRGKTKNYEDWLTEAGWRLNQQRPGRIDGAYEIEIRIVRPDNRRRDLGNLEKAISDILVHYRVVSDDSLAERITLAWMREDTGARVIVSKYMGAA